MRLSLVTCPVELYPAAPKSEQVSFNQLYRKTGHRIEYDKVNADTGEAVANDDIVKGYKVDTDTIPECSARRHCSTVKSPACGGKPAAQSSGSRNAETGEQCRIHRSTRS